MVGGKFCIYTFLHKFVSSKLCMKKKLGLVSEKNNMVEMDNVKQFLMSTVAADTFADGHLIHCCQVVAPLIDFHTFFQSVQGIADSNQAECTYARKQTLIMHWNCG